MGLAQDWERPTAVALIARWWLPAGVSVLASLALLLGENAQKLLRFDRIGIESGELFRLFSGHFVHLGTSHLILNLAGLMLVWFLVAASFSGAQWLIVLLASLLAIDLGFWFFMPHLEWYVGLSGVLHGLLLAGIIGLWRRQRTEALILITVVMAKLVYESLLGPIPGSVASSGGEVITEAHLFGAIGGAVSGFLLSIKVRKGIATL